MSAAAIIVSATAPDAPSGQPRRNPDRALGEPPVARMEQDVIRVRPSDERWITTWLRKLDYAAPHPGHDGA
jgi:hypothetical protein